MWLLFFLFTIDNIAVFLLFSISSSGSTPLTRCIRQESLMQNNNYIFEILSKCLSYIFEVNNFILLIFFGYLVFLFYKKVFKSRLTKIKRKNQNTDKGSKYFDYAPIDLIDEYKSQEEIKNLNINNSTPYAEQFKELKSFLENDNVKNLAVFGSYGAGKSSFIKTFFNHFTENNRREDDEVIYISLPDFDYRTGSKNKKYFHNSQREPDGNTNLKLNTKTITLGKQSNFKKEDTLKNNLDSKAETSEVDTCKLDLETVETEIIRQLVCSKISKKIPVSLFSNFKSDFLEMLKITFVIFCCITFFLLYLNQQVERKNFFSTDIYIFPKLSLLFLLIHYFIKYIFRRFRFSNISFFNVGVSAKDKYEESIFDSYLDEITYLFEESNCRYVVFEDLDRTKNYEVLTHLRKLNYILNNDYRCTDNITGKQRKIVFIYVIRSDIFTSAQESVKFFDASIHVQNIITSANSWEFFIKFRDELYKIYKNDRLKKEFLSNKTLTDEFLSNIAFFVTDLRLAKMIFNEYLNILGSLEVILSNIENHYLVFFGEKIFSYAVFRTTYPLESETLLRDEGCIYKFLNKKFNYWGKSNNQEKISISKEKELSHLGDEIQTNKNLKLLYLLLSISYLSEDYRLYGAVFTKNVFKNEDADRKFFLGILNLSDDFCPELDISEYFARVVLQYFPYTIFRCLFILNFNFYTRIFKDHYLTNDNKKRLDLYISYLIECCSSKPDKKYISNSNHTKFSFILELMDHLDKLISEKKETISFFNFCIEIIIHSIFNSIDDKNSTLESYPIFYNIGSEKLLTYIFIYANNILKKEYKENYIKQIKNELIRIDYSGKFLSYLVENTGLMNDNFFDSLDFLKFKFKRLTINYSSKKDNSYKFNKILANKLPHRNQLNAIEFFFEPSWFNFSHISQFLIDNNNSSSNIPNENSILTSIFTSTSEDFTTFQDAFFRAVFSVQQYENILLFNGITMRKSIKDSEVDFLQDRNEINLFVIFLVNYFVLKNKNEAKRSTSFFGKGFEFFCHYDIPKDNNELNSLNLDNYKFQNQKLSDAEKVIMCFLDYEFNEIDNFSDSYKKAIANKDSVYLKFLKKIQYEKKIRLFEKEEAKFALVASLLMFSFIEKQNEFTPKHKITPNINNIIDLKELIDQTYTNENNRDYKISEPTFNSAYNRCWEILTKFFHIFYKEIFASDKDKQYKLDPDFDKSPYSFEKTKQYISSLKKQDN